VDLSAPTAVLEGTPAAKNNLTSIAVSVAGTDVVAYRFSVDGSSYSSEKPASSPIGISSIAAGHHDIAVVGRDAQGNWQSTDSPTRFAWQSDFTATTAVLSQLPDQITNVTSYEITVAGDDLASFRYTLDGTSSAVINDGASISLRNIREGNHTLDVYATDSFGNTQSTATSYSWKVDTTAPAAPAMYESVSLSESENLIFNFTAPSGADKADVQISTDPTFSSVTYQSGTFSVSEGSSSFTYTASESNGNTYYARVRAGDTAGNWSSYGTKSGKVILVGSLTGEIRNNSGAVLSGATIRIFDSANVSQTTATTGSDGKFIASGIPAGISDYYATVEMSGYSNATKANIAVHTGVNSDSGIITLVSTSALPGTVTGKIVNANDGTRISGATVAILNYRGTVVDTKQTTNGAFTSISLSPGTYSAKITKSNFFDMRVDNIIVNGNVDIGNQAICELLTGNHFRVVLIWGAQPKDLDLHVVGPSDASVSHDGDPVNRFHVYWTQKSFDASTGKYSGETGFTSYTSSLVQDSTGGYGVESVNSLNLMAHGFYTFTVHNYSQANWYLSSPVIRIYDNQGLVQEIPIPSGAGSQWYWKAFQINIQGDTRDQRTVRIENKFGTLNYSSKTAMDWQLESGGVTAYLLSVAKGEHPALIAMLLFIIILFAGLYLWNRKKTGTDDSTPL
ncbi:MAG TPA: carboxypeptidase regulatory-like domain-containing protein, partial [Spirochaetota bacterium]|nr:carboxypeptidase regulatory-like domain-containing protein [Spirochaetota bacterium]